MRLQCHPSSRNWRQSTNLYFSTGNLTIPSYLLPHSTATSFLPFARKIDVGYSISSTSLSLSLRGSCPSAGLHLLLFFSSLRPSQTRLVFLHCSASPHTSPFQLLTFHTNSPLPSMILFHLNLNILPFPLLFFLLHSCSFHIIYFSSISFDVICLIPPQPPFFF